MCIYRSGRAALGSNDPHSAQGPLTYDNDAHVITQGLGWNQNVFPRGVLCDRCNSYFGNTLEPALIMHPGLAADMQRLGVPGRDAVPRQAIANWLREQDGSYGAPFMSPEAGGLYNGVPLIVIKGLMDRRFDHLRFRRGLHMLAFNVLAHLHVSGQAPEPFFDPEDSRYDQLRKYIRAPRSPGEAWPFVERYDPPPAGGQTAVHLFPPSQALVGRIRAFSYEFYVDLLNTGNLLAWTETQGLDRVRLVRPDEEYPACSRDNEVPPRRRGWLGFKNG